MKTEDPKSALRFLFNAADPQGIFFGDNVDEYDPEIAKLIEVLPACSTATQVHDELWVIFQGLFGKSARTKDDYSALAESVFRWKLGISSSKK